MKIGELANKSGLTKDTIRLYERMDLLVDITQPHQNNSYKEYSDKNLHRIELIRYSQSLGFSLKECKYIAEALENGKLTPEEKSKLIKNKLNEIDKRVEQLKNFRVLLEEALKKTCED